MNQPDTPRNSSLVPRPSVFDEAEACLRVADPDTKLQQTRTVAAAWQAGELGYEAGDKSVSLSEPGRPARPELVAPRDLPARSTASEAGRAALIHSICHIEFNAINLAWDAVYRFRDLLGDYYTDWIKVAREEAYHFSLLRDHLRHLGYDYGDFPAHNGLWEMCLQTAHDPLVRMALVPRVLEARGLDVTPGIMRKLEQSGDDNAVDLLRIIQRDEVGHVAIGSRWFRYLCEQRSLPPEATFRELFNQYMPAGGRGPLDRASRLQAGFSEAELDYIEGAG
ncbi:ferritin-like domain-containing protein [Thiohalophilus sp.]|uniref:ferritin-like domain-containing protein n=1 Tax=Thiohalophilus sp. TaxID=3028392 RepID=UPI002ACD9F86|nr:ferritin-like domain-containing protein [Thiohalophilus sp.]MDZ7804239.1 ferritin-like domain-containing protein [Thiohalophilus sp.]